MSTNTSDAMNTINRPRLLSDLFQDIRYGLRILRRAPGFAFAAVLSLGLAIATASSAFSEINGLLLRDSPGETVPDNLVTMERQISYPTYLRLQAADQVFASSLAYAAPIPFGVRRIGQTERVWGQIVTRGYFLTLGVQPALGRFPAEGAYNPSGCEAVISYRYWSDRFASNVSPAGAAIEVNGHSCSIAGVGPKDFLGASPLMAAADIWLPVDSAERVAPELADGELQQHNATLFRFVGRLKQGISAGRAEAALDGIIRNLEAEYHDDTRDQKGKRVTLLPGGKLIPIRKQNLPVLMGSLFVLSALIILIASTNVANMLLARAAGRQKEIAIRLSLGSGRGRLIRQLMAENMIIAAMAGTAGYVLTVWLMRLASQLRLPYPMPVEMNLSPDAGVLLFTAILTLGTGIGFGLVPAIQASSLDLTSSLKGAGSFKIGRIRALSPRNILLVAQVAGSITLLTLTAVMVFGYQRTMNIQIGFTPANLHLFAIDPIRDGIPREEAAGLVDRALDRVRAQQGVISAAATAFAPLAFAAAAPVIVTTPAISSALREIKGADKLAVGGDYFQTMEIGLLSGRVFGQQAESSDFNAAVVNEKLASQLWAGASALGNQLDIVDSETTPLKFGSPLSYRSGTSMGGRASFRVIGIVKNANESLSMKGEDRPTLYVRLKPSEVAQPSPLGITIAVRSDPGVDIFDPVRRQLAALDSRLTMFDTHTMNEQLQRLEYPFQMTADTYGCLGMFGLVLACVGLAGATSFSVASRLREIGIRLALGSSKAHVVQGFLRETVILTLVGGVFGTLGSLAGNRLLSAISSSISKTSSGVPDGLILAGVPLLFLAVALAACLLPAMRASRVDPMIALRQD